VAAWLVFFVSGGVEQKSDAKTVNCNVIEFEGDEPRSWSLAEDGQIWLKVCILTVSQGNQRVSEEVMKTEGNEFDHCFYHHGEAASSDLILTEGVQSTLWRAVSVTEG